MDAVMLQHGPRPVVEVLQRAGQLAAAIDFAASAGVHHGLMAPCDVILDGERTGVTGFGLAQALIKAGIPAEAGSPYGSPQRLAGAPPTHADDIYSLAAITLELLIGTPKDPDQDTSRALREAQGLTERRRMPRPAAHETRVFTTIAGVDAGKLRAAFAAAFSDEPSERPSAASDFVARFQDAFSGRRGAEESAPGVAAVSCVSEEPEGPPSAPVVDAMPAEGGAPPEPPVRQERVVPEGRAARRRRARARRRERLATSQPLIRESHEHEPHARTPGTLVARPVPVKEVELLGELTAPRASSIDGTSYRIPAQPAARVFLATAIVAVSFAAGFGGGFVVGHVSRPSTESMDVSQHEPVAQPQPARAAVEDAKPVAAPPKTVAPMSEEKVSSSAPIAATVAPQHAVVAVETGRLLVRSTPAGASVVIDGESRGVTPLAVRELAFGAHAIEISHPGHETRKQRVTLSNRRPARSIDVALRSTSAPAHATAATNSTGSLQVASRPAGAQVFVDDNLIGTTPLLLSNVAAGSKRLRIELSGYQIWTTSVQIEPSERFRVAVSLQP
jgi:hypothetical protein